MNNSMQTQGSDTGVFGLQPKDVVMLNYPFQLHEHKFLQGKVYIREQAIAARLDKVDPNWQYMIVKNEVNGNSVITVAQLQIKGVIRSNTGSGSALFTDKPNMLSDNFGNAYKGAATDAFKRCARLFGVGRSLLSAPSEQEFPRWLATSCRMATVSMAVRRTGLTPAGPSTSRTTSMRSSGIG